MNLKFKLSFVSIIVFIGAFLFIVAPTQAITISPIIVDVDGEPGTPFFGTVTIINDDNIKITYYLNTQNFVAQGEDGKQMFLDNEKSFGLATWIVPEAKTITLEPGEFKEVHYSILIPSDAEPGGHYAVLFFSTEPQTKEGSVSVGVGAKTGVLILARVAGDIQEKVSVESFLVTNGPWMNYLPAYFELRIRNAGNIHFRPQGNIVIKNIFGRLVGTVPLNPKNAAALPGSIRRIESYWAKTLDLEKGGGFVNELKNEWKNFAIGRYKAIVVGTAGKSNQKFTAEAPFWVIPWRIMLLALIALVLLVILIRGYNKLVVRSAIRKQNSQ